MNTLQALLAALSTITVLAAQTAEPQPKAPNLVLILADDLGFGDVHALNPDSELPTPNLDRLAGEGMVFTDAHSPSAVCTPTRYGLLTGRYCWRSKLKRGVLGGYSPPLLEPGRPTIGNLYQDAGFRTAAIGKWHLGMDLPIRRDVEDPNLGKWPGDPGIDFGGRVTDGPLQHGFDRFLGVTASLDMPPYVLVSDDRFLAEERVQQKGIRFPRFVRAGPRAKRFEFANALDDLAQGAQDFLRESKKSGAPFFLYVPLTAPHKPTWPHPRFEGSTSLGPYGDFVVQVDATIGQILKTLDELGLKDDTIVAVTSDNGSYMFRVPLRDGQEPQPDHVDDPRLQRYRADRHRANGPFRGTKADIWEAGHRIPMIVRWPGRTKPGTRCDQTVCLTDWFATAAEMLSFDATEVGGEDSFSLLPLLRGESPERGAPVVHHSVNGTFAIRDGRFKLVASNGSGGREKPAGKPFGEPYQLFDLVADPTESKDLASELPDEVKRLTALLQKLRDDDRSTPLPDREKR